MKLKRQVVVITGAGAGIGRACAAECAKEGAVLAVVDLNLAGAQETVRQLKKKGSRAAAFKADVADPASVKKLAAAVLKAFGPASALVNNAAIQVNKSLEDTTPEEWSRQMAVNLGGVFHGAKYFLPQLRQTRGSIVNMASVNGFFAEPDCAGYCATKGGIIAFTKALAIDLGRDGIRVNCVCPGYIDAGLSKGYFDSQADPAGARRAASGLQALGRIGRPEEVGRVVAFLASEEASFMTGSAVVVDGGFGSGIPKK